MQQHPQGSNYFYCPIKVYIKVKPSKVPRKSVRLQSDQEITLIHKGTSYQFDSLFHPEITQPQFFQKSCSPIIDHVIQGFNGCLFVYGQTGTGKTYSMGTLQKIQRKQQGLVSMSLDRFFQATKGKQCKISLSFMQIYMQQVHDLLDPNSGKLQIRQDLEHSQVYVQNLTLVPIQNYKQGIQLINAGLNYRKVGNQKMNQLSSRSHTILTVYYQERIDKSFVKLSSFSLIDLAGSQRLKKSNSTGLRLEQTKFINTSLSALGNVISGLSQNKVQKFINYRSSKLTRILQNSLTGKSMVSIVCTIQPSQQNAHQTLSTLSFAARCKIIKFNKHPIPNIQRFEEQISLPLHDQLLQIKKKQSQVKMLKVQNQFKQRIKELQQLIEVTITIMLQINKYLNKIIAQSQLKPVKTFDQFQYKFQHKAPIKQIKGKIRLLSDQTINNINFITLHTDRIKPKDGPQQTHIAKIVFDLLQQNKRLYQTLQKQRGKDSLQVELKSDNYFNEMSRNVIRKLQPNPVSFELQKLFQSRQSFIQPDPFSKLLNQLRSNSIMKKQGKSINDLQFQSQVRDNSKDNVKSILKIIREEEQKVGKKNI